jgi:hypothetical protein
VVSLDEYLPTLNLPQPDLIKIDAEGWDLEVLKGAGESVERAEVVLLEASVMNKIFKNNVNDVTSAMSELGFTFFDITDLNRTQKQNALWLMEIAFVKRESWISQKVDTY